MQRSVSVRRIVAVAKIRRTTTFDFLTRKMIFKSGAICVKFFSWLIAMAAICGAGGASAASVTHHYTVTVDYSLSRLSIEARFEKPVYSVAARSRDAGKFLLDVRGCTADQQIKIRNRRMLLPEHGISCLNYTVDLARAAKENRNSKLLLPGNIIASPIYWLWRPEMRNGTSIQVEFRLPQDVQVSVPWQRLDGSKPTYLLGKSPESAHAPAIFGNFDYRELDVPGAVLRVSILNGVHEMDNDAIANWITATANDVGLAYGRFPNPSPQIVVVAVGDSNRNSRSAVPFGRVVRDGGETVELFVDQTQPLSALLADWTATHEFSHLMLPYLDRRQRWISEGFSQYYQNVLLARSGAYEDLYAWQKLYAGYERGRKARPELSPNEATERGVSGGLMKVYWSGAALALMADVTLRERSAGEESLDAVLEKFQACCLPSDRVWTGKELFTKFDTLASAPVFMPLYRRYADTAGFPDTSNVFERLGVSVSDDVVSMRHNTELERVRQSITATDSEAAERRKQIATF